ncbi:ABC transporter ATP-binding protein [Xanthobacter sp. ZOL 2024]
MAALDIQGLEKTYANGFTAVAGLDLKIGKGELVSLLGPSGCGKTTTLRMVAGFIDPTAGRITIEGREVTHLPAHARDTGMVFQSYALFPHMSVAQNVAFGLEMRKVGRAEREARTVEALKRVQLDHLAERYPRQLSGGQQQRVALARALVVNPAVFLLDEPLSNLDAKLRGEVRSEIRALQQALGLTTLMVTHDQEEALTMSDRLVVMEGGRVRQAGTAEDLYERPADAFVANFVGRSNLIRGRLAEGAFEAASGTRLACVPGGAGTGPLVFALRPERIGLSVGDDASGEPAVLKEILYLGAQTEYVVALGAERLTVIRPTPAAGDPLHAARPGDGVRASWTPEHVRLLPDT